MPLTIKTVPCLKDNYAYIAHDPETGTTAVIDVPDAAPIIAALEANGWAADLVLLTHHHDDHVQGLDALKDQYPSAKVIGAEADAHRLPTLDMQVAEGETIEIGSEKLDVIDVSGHTIGHIAFYAPGSSAAFTADSLMCFGCGRVFEGTMEQMWGSLRKLMALPEDTLIYSGHEYTEANAKFARTIEPNNSALISRIESVAMSRAEGRPTVPARLREELATNPFLRGHVPEVQAAAGMPGAEASAVFAKVRKMKDSF
ncbi:hydroxyacylglutathione hydrolase [Poseidonocella pacifica]|uniref:Hydroxyacylglutathione hydrolase n=1 Tax=Poseidonocella pacifica TaxID=871651 RepID=A0A1I0XI03_9RHOB|nr:hydroxyacylglutathione hydrolase [Poseidonocella pacifica]SFA99583.1 hydroxyacylglutathione hydrolase [Poseidonocella pacifica]